MTEQDQELEAALQKVRDTPPQNTAPPQEQESLPAVIIVKQKDDEGNITTDVMLQGVEPTEVQTIIELGLIRWRSKIGLPR